MWGAIIQAIDHAAERSQKGLRGGIDVANSQHGGAAKVDNIDTANKQTETKQLEEPAKEESKPEAQSPTTAQGGGEGSGILGGAGAGASAGGGISAGAGGAGDAIGGVGGGISAGAGGAGAGAGAGISAGAGGAGDAIGSIGGGGGLGSIISDERLKAKQLATSVKSKWHVLSDGRSKNARQYASNVGNGMAEAARIATGQSSGGAKISNESDSKTAADIQSEADRNSNAKKAEESIKAK